MFLRVVESGSFTQAGEHMGVPKASISNAISQLESHLGTRLIHRTTRRLQITQDGQMFYDRSKDLLADFDELESLFQHNVGQVCGRLRVDMPSRMASNLIIPHLPDFFQRYPKIELELSSTDRFVDLVQEGFDCVLRVGLLADSELIAKPLGQLSLVNCASPAYLQQYGTPSILAHLAHHKLIHYVGQLGGKRSGWAYFDGEKNNTIDMDGALTVNSAHSYITACLSGLGIIQTPLPGVQAHLEKQELIEILPDYRPQSMPVTLLYPHRRHLSRRVHLFTDWVSHLLQGYMR